LRRSLGRKKWIASFIRRCIKQIANLLLSVVRDAHVEQH
jgi:hypothetical protein